MLGDAVEGGEGVEDTGIIGEEGAHRLLGVDTNRAICISHIVS